MKIIDAYWELRNLGVSTQEVEIEDSDSIYELAESIDGIHASYQVIKTPSSRLDVYKLLAEKGYSYIESLIRVSYELKNLSCPNLIKRLSDQIGYDDMDQDEISLMEEQIQKGMFRTDRVTIDPYFSKSQATNRFVMWMRDEKDRGSKFYAYKYKGQSIGFSCFKETCPGVFYPVLGGIYEVNKALPIGTAIFYKQLEIAKNLGGKELYTFISSNNQAAVRTYSLLGYLFEEIKNVFIKHV